MQLLTGGGPEPLCMAFSPDGRALAVGDLHAIRLWDLTASPEPLWAVSDGYVGQNFCFLPDGRSLIGGLYDHYRRLDAATGEATSVPDLTGFSPEQFTTGGRFGLAVTAPYGNRKFRLQCVRALATGGWSGACRR